VKAPPNLPRREGYGGDKSEEGAMNEIEKFNRKI
jgi:hypothetical protein